MAIELQRCDAEKTQKIVSPTVNTVHCTYREKRPRNPSYYHKFKKLVFIKQGPKTCRGW